MSLPDFFYITSDKSLLYTALCTTLFFTALVNFFMELHTNLSEKFGKKYEVSACMKHAYININCQL